VAEATESGRFTAAHAGHDGRLRAPWRTTASGVLQTEIATVLGVFSKTVEETSIAREPVCGIAPGAARTGRPPSWPYPRSGQGMGSSRPSSPMTLPPLITSNSVTTGPLGRSFMLPPKMTTACDPTDGSSTLG
jgi:hypothetical protein